MVVLMSKHALMAASDRSNSRCGGFLYSAFAATFRAFRGIDFATRLRWLFNLLKPRAIAGGANDLSQNFTRSFHLGYSHPVSKFLKFRKLYIERANVAEENGYAIRLSAYRQSWPYRCSRANRTRRLQALKCTH